MPELHGDARRETLHARPRALWELLQGEVLESGWQNEDVKDALDLCLSCKACKTECPTNVDIATYKAEFLAHYYEGRSRPCAYAFGLIDRWARIASRTATRECPRAIPLTAGIAKGLLKIAPQRKLPEFSNRTFRSRIAKTEGAGRNSGSAKSVLLWADTFCKLFPAPHCRGGVSGALGRRIQRQGPPTPCVLRAAAV